MRPLGILAILALSTSPLSAQVPPIGSQCGARVCEEVTIYAVAIDSALKRPHADGTGTPRVLRLLYLTPFDAMGMHGTPVGQLDTTADLDMLQRYWTKAQIIDSARVVGPDGHTLRPDGPLYVASPIDWTGEDSARLQLAEYPHDLRWGTQLFVFLRRGQHGWHVSEISVGAIN